MAEIKIINELQPVYNGDDGRIVQLQRADGTTICYFPITLFEAVFNSAGANLNDILDLLNNKLDTNSENIKDKLGLADVAKFDIITPEDTSNYTEPALYNTDTVNVILGKLQLWWNIIKSKADAYNAQANIGSVIKAHSAVTDGNGDNIVATYARKDDVNKAIQVKGSVPTLAYLHGLADVKPGYMYTISYDPATRPEGSPEETFQVYYESTDSGERELIEGPLITVDDGAAFIYTGLYDEIYGTKEFGANDGNWMFSGSDIDYSKFAEKEFTPYVLVGPEISYSIDLSDLFK